MMIICYSINESCFSHVNVSNISVSVTYHALQLEIGVGVFAEARGMKTAARLQ